VSNKRTCPALFLAGCRPACVTRPILPALVVGGGMIGKVLP